jgi:hypothetical protein
VVAGVFVRVFNEQPAAALADPAAFCRGLVTYMHAQAAPAAFAQAAADAAAAARGAPPPVAAQGSGLTSTRQPLTVRFAAAGSMRCLGDTPCCRHHA